jgi:hypothetical protein
MKLTKLLFESKTKLVILDFIDELQEQANEILDVSLTPTKLEIKAYMDWWKINPTGEAYKLVVKNTDIKVVYNIALFDDSKVKLYSGKYGPIEIEGPRKKTAIDDILFNFKGASSYKSAPEHFLKLGFTAIKRSEEPFKISFYNSPNSSKLFSKIIDGYHVIVALSKNSYGHYGSEVFACKDLKYKDTTHMGIPFRTIKGYEGALKIALKKAERLDHGSLTNEDCKYREV